MNRFEFFAKLVVPAFFLIVWALNQIFNKETPATPARGNRPVGPPGGRPTVPPRPSEEDRAFASADPKSGAWTSSSDPRNKTVTLAGDDEVLILSSETVRRSPPARPRTQSSPPVNRPRQGKRPKGSGSEAGRSDVDKPQLLGGNISQSVSQSIRPTPLDMKSITQTQPLNLTADLRGSQGSASMVSSTASIAGSSGPAVEVFDLLGTLHSRSRLREAFLLNELLQPPVALRHLHQRPNQGASHR